jgi:hypothetical protein
MVPSKRMHLPTRKQWAELNHMAFLKGICDYETFVSQTKRQKTNLKSRQHILRVIIQYYSSRNTGTTQVDKGQNQKYHVKCIHNNIVVLNDLKPTQK